MSITQSQSSPPVIEVRQVRKSLGGSLLIDQINFDLSRGQSAAILGESGSGKSTLLHVMAGLEPADEGQIFWAGKAISGLSPDQQASERLAHIGLVFQAFYLLPHLTALQNVELPFLLAGKPVMHAHCQHLLESVGMLDKANLMPKEMSGGEQQRVAIARALALSPPLILADEPTGNLDEHNAGKVLSVLLTACRASDCGLVMVTHSTQVARQLGQQFQLKAGQFNRLESI